jgi:phage-related protein
MAAYNSDFEQKFTNDRKMVKFTVSFDRKPQRFLLAGEEKTTLTESGQIVNPTQFESQPLIRVYGTGVLGIGTQSVTITRSDGYTDIDFETMDAYKGATSKNRFVEFSANQISFATGTVGISLGSGITQVEITPRWWRV